MAMEDILALERILISFRDYKVVFENHYLAADKYIFTKVVEISIRPDLKKIKVRLGEDDTDIDNL